MDIGSIGGLMDRWITDKQMDEWNEFPCTNGYINVYLYDEFKLRAKRIIK